MCMQHGKTFQQSLPWLEIYGVLDCTAVDKKLRDIVRLRGGSGATWHKTAKIEGLASFPGFMGGLENDGHASRVFVISNELYTSTDAPFYRKLQMAGLYHILPKL